VEWWHIEVVYVVCSWLNEDVIYCCLKLCSWVKSSREVEGDVLEG
jgi:hypothetical protein